MKALYWLCLVLIIIGGINWGLVGLFHFNLVDFIFGKMSMLSRIIYIVVGAAALIIIYAKASMCKKTEQQ